MYKIYNISQHAFSKKLSDTYASNLRKAGYMGISTTSGGDAHEKNFLHENFKVVKDCDNSSGCFASSYRNINGSSVNVQIDGYRVVIAGGAAVSLNIYNGSNPIDSVGYITVDTNGEKGPNIIGKDLFEMVVYPDGDVSTWINKHCSGNSCNTQIDTYFNSYCKSANNIWGATYCFSKLLKDNWEMNY